MPELVYGHICLVNVTLFCNFLVVKHKILSCQNVLLMLFVLDSLQLPTESFSACFAAAWVLVGVAQSLRACTRSARARATSSEITYNRWITLQSDSERQLSTKHSVDPSTCFPLNFSSQSYQTISLTSNELMPNCFKGQFICFPIL